MLCIYARIAVGLLGTCLCNLFTSFYSFMEFVDGSSEQTKLRIASIRRLPILFSNMRMACPNCILFFSELRFLNFVFTNYTRYTLCKNFVKCAYQDCNSCNVCGHLQNVCEMYFSICLIFRNTSLDPKSFVKYFRSTFPRYFINLSFFLKIGFLFLMFFFHSKFLENN